MYFKIEISIKYVGKQNYFITLFLETCAHACELYVRKLTLQTG